MNARINKPVPENTVIDENGNIMRDPNKVLAKMLERKASLLPLGGKGEETAGYKGYGYATIVELLSAALQDGIFLRDTLGINENGQKRNKASQVSLGFLALARGPVSWRARRDHVVCESWKEDPVGRSKKGIYKGGGSAC